MYIYDEVICHYGNLTSGHYVALSKNNLNNKWYEFDDDEISVTNHEDVVTEAGYLLFYQRRTSKIASGRHWCLRMPQVQKAINDARNGIVDESKDEHKDEPSVDEQSEEIRHRAATLARAAVNELQKNNTVGRHNSTPGLMAESHSYSEGENYIPMKARSGASTGALLGTAVTNSNRIVRFSKV